MNFPQFWARGRSGEFFTWRWSFQSLAEAQALAEEAAQQLADRFRMGLLPPRHGGYYPNRPFREQILQEIKNGAGEVSAVITLNSYGCQVLNTKHVMFVDIDLPEPKRSGGFFQRLFGNAEVVPSATAESESMAKIESWSRSNSAWGWRVYRTRSGLRLLATQGLFDADSDSARAAFEALGADPLYRKLCQTQKCFRARLTPKPWRCGMTAKPDRWPWLEPKHEKRFQKWETAYRQKAANFATCEFVRHVGNPQVHPEVQPIIKLHDSFTRADPRLPLA